MVSRQTDLKWPALHMLSALSGEMLAALSRAVEQKQFLCRPWSFEWGGLEAPGSESQGSEPHQPRTYAPQAAALPVCPRCADPCVPLTEVADIRRPFYGRGANASSAVCVGVHDGRDAGFVALAAPLSALAYGRRLRRWTVIVVQGFEVGTDADGKK